MEPPMEDGWIRVDCILYSGASESVCPLNMCPLYQVQDSPGSLIEFHYTVANGGKIKNRGQQRLPVELGNGTKSHLKSIGLDLSLVSGIKSYPAPSTID